MSQFFAIHTQNPQPRLIRRAADIIRDGGIVVYPTDSCYALGCHVGDKGAMERIRAIRGIDERHHLTLVCRDLSEEIIFLFNGTSLSFIIFHGNDTNWMCRKCEEWLEVYARISRNIHQKTLLSRERFLVRRDSIHKLLSL